MCIRDKSTASVKLVTATSLGVWRSSGSATSLPITTATFNIGNNSLSSFQKTYSAADSSLASTASAATASTSIGFGSAALRGFAAAFAKRGSCLLYTSPTRGPTGSSAALETVCRRPRIAGDTALRAAPRAPAHTCLLYTSRCV